MPNYCSCANCQSPTAKLLRLVCEVDQYAKLVRDGGWRSVSVASRVRIINQMNDRARKVGVQNAV